MSEYSPEIQAAHDQIEAEHPGFKSRLATMTAKQAAQLAEQVQTTQAWRERERIKFTDLSFVGPAYRSRNRRSADKVSSWAVPVPPNTTEGLKEAAAEGVRMAFEFSQWCADSGSARRGRGLAEIVESMADTLARSTPYERYLHKHRMRGFFMMVEHQAFVFLQCGDDAIDASKALTMAARHSDMASYEDQARRDIAFHVPLWDES